MDFTSLGARLRRERMLRNWTQEQLAEKAGISLSFLGHIERGSRKASLETLVTLANALGVGLDGLACDSLNRRPRLNSTQPPSKQQLALQEILRIVEDALATWGDDE